jgi:hypothetical protein
MEQRGKRFLLVALSSLIWLLVAVVVVVDRELMVPVMVAVAQVATAAMFPVRTLAAVWLRNHHLGCFRVHTLSRLGQVVQVRHKLITQEAAWGAVQDLAQFLLTVAVVVVLALTLLLLLVTPRERMGLLVVAVDT